jgi:hypothetical protein
MGNFGGLTAFYARLLASRCIPAEPAPRGVPASALTRFNECGGADEPDPIERLRFFCSLAMTGEDWLDVEPFFDAIKPPPNDDPASPLNAHVRGGTDAG